MPLPKSYRTIEEFEREELRPSNKAGFSFDDLMQETMLHQNDLLFDDQVDELEPDDDDDDDY
ncbi:MAG: transcriptional regulator [Myxococcota bacterium]|nr:transcriptional regulator [Myxococcota bacterium]